MTFKFCIEGRLPSLNEFIGANRTNKYVGNKLKAQAQNVVEVTIKQALFSNPNHSNISPFSLPVVIHYVWYEPNSRRDIDNISGFGHKVIQDALVSAGVLTDDSMRYVVGYTDLFFVDKKHPRIEVELESV